LSCDLRPSGSDTCRTPTRASRTDGSAPATWASGATESWPSSALPPVLEVQVFGVPGPDTTDELVRAVIACPPGTLDREEVVAWCRERLTGHKIPRSVVLVEQIPRTVRGKIDRAALTRLEP